MCQSIYCWILLADDDMDDRFFFDLALKQLLIETKLTTIENGEELMIYLNKTVQDLPDLLFMDINMPRKSGKECPLQIEDLFIYISQVLFTIEGWD